MSNENQLTESQLFTIEALNKIQGFVWPKNANHAFMNHVNRFVSFSSGACPVIVSGADGICQYHGIYAGDISVGTYHPYWRGSLITREQFDSVDGWVRCDGCMPVSRDEVVQISLNFGVSGGKTDSASKFAWGDGGITHWRYHKRENGWYLIKRYEAAEWEPAEYVGNDRWLIAGVDSKVLLGDDDLIINESRLLITSEGCVVQK